MYALPRLGSLHYRLLEPNGTFPVIDRIATLDDLAERVRAIATRRAAMRGSAPNFPAPPYPSNGNIVAITSADALVDEGILQKNCAADYLGRILRGSHYLYRVHLPERCTLSLCRTAHGWDLDQLRGTCNAVLERSATRRVVSRWLSENRPVARSI